METTTTITEAQFRAYEKVRQSGVTNMFMISSVEDLSGLDRPEILDIMKNYKTYMDQWPQVRNELQNAVGGLSGQRLEIATQDWEHAKQYEDFDGSLEDYIDQNC